MKNIVIIIYLILSVVKVDAQDYTFRKNINKDSLFNTSIKFISKQKQEELKEIYKKGNEQEKEFILLMISMPRSSKKELISNYENKEKEILNLRMKYQKYIPEDYIVDIEFEPESKIFNVPEQITIKIYQTKDKSIELVSQHWNLKHNSNELKKVIKSINWTDKTFKKIKSLLKKANCISIKNGNITTIGFARSGLGKYSYVFYKDKSLKYMNREFEQGCNYIHFKDYIALNYEGGATGPICFPDPK